jgi:uncharacterized glyoxalase superfamily protein PhnB
MSSTVIPCLRYRDAPHMIGWLCDTFGFKRHAVYEDGQAVSPMPSSRWVRA